MSRIHASPPTAPSRGRARDKEAVEGAETLWLRSMDHDSAQKRASRAIVPDRRKAESLSTISSIERVIGFLFLWALLIAMLVGVGVFLSGAGL